MLNSLFRGATLAALLLAGQTALAADWQLDNDRSKLAFGSIKKDSVGEVHHFQQLSGQVSSSGTVEIDISLPSIETFIDIRNERMIEHVFKGATAAKLTAQIDLAALEALPAGGTTVTEIDGKLNLLGRDIPIEAEIFVARLSETKALITTDNIVFLGIEDAGLTAGVDILQSLAKLSGITRTTPVTARFVFTATEDAAQASQAQPAEVAVAGDATLGKKVFRKCKACHSLKEGKNGAGPSLHGILGAASAQVPGFKYSKAFQQADLTWSIEQLQAFILDPKGIVPGNRMAFKGLKKPEEAENLIAYLQEQG